MARPTISDSPMPDKQRRERSSGAKLLRGERRLSNWINAEAAEALDVLIEGDTSRGAIKAAIEAALVKAAKSKRPSKN